MASICGHVGRIIYRGDNFFVFSFIVDKAEPAAPEKTTTVSGHLYGLEQVAPGVPVQFVGDWKRHPKYGRQFTPYGWFPWATHDVGVEQFLTQCVPGFADTQVVEELVAQFGTLVFDKLSEEPAQVIATADEGTPKRMMLETAVLLWAEARAISNLSIFLQDYDLKETVIQAVFDRFGSDAVSIIAENPYRLVAVEGFAFDSADKLANRIGITKDDPRRMDGAILWVLKKAAQEGHLSVRRGDLPSLLSELSIKEINGLAVEAHVNTSIERMAECGIVRIDSGIGVYLAEYYRYERDGATKLAKFIRSHQLDINVPEFITAYEKSNQIQLSEAQRAALMTLTNNSVLALTGNPGTGKTTVIRALVRLLKQSSTSFLLMAPTAIAAKRMASVTGESAMTIHRTFGCDGQSWGFNNQNKFGVGAVIVDEMSMVDQELFYRVLDALHPTTLLVLVGDDAQLPSVGPGNVLKEILATKSIPHVRLTHIFRQSHQSEIVIAAHQVNNGEVPQLDAQTADSEFQFVSIQNEDQVASLIVQIAAKLKGRDANFQVLAPKYDGIVGVNNLNELLREELNPLGRHQSQWKVGQTFFRVGDRIMVIKNDYKLNVYNGDVAKLVEIGKTFLRIRIHGIGNAPDIVVDIPKGSALRLLKLAYAITVHRCQGAEHDTIIMPIMRSHGRMLQRNLFYTAITRAKKKVWLLGDSASVCKAVGNDRVVSRNTAFSKAIEDALKTGVEAPVEPTDVIA